MPHVNVDGVRIHYKTYGQDSPPTVLFIHGLGSCCEDWPFQVPAFGEMYRVLTVDLRGHGLTDKPRGRYSIAQFAEDVVGLLDAVGETSVHVVGLSMGGCTGLQLASAHAARVRSLTLVNTFARLQPAGLRGALRFIMRAVTLSVASMNLMATLVSQSMFPKPEQKPLCEAAIARIAGNDKAPYRRAIRAVLRFDARAACASIGCPTLVVAGDRDLTVPLSAKHYLRDRIPGAEFALITDSGHATPLDQPEEFNRVVMAFIDRHR